MIKVCKIFSDAFKRRLKIIDRIYCLDVHAFNLNIFNIDIALQNAQNALLRYTRQLTLEFHAVFSGRACPILYMHRELNEQNALMNLTEWRIGFLAERPRQPCITMAAVLCRDKISFQTVDI